MMIQDVLEAFDATAAMPTLTPLPPPSGGGPSDTLVIVGTMVGIAALIGVGVLYNSWAYQDWTCMFKNCVQTSTSQRRRR